MTPRLDQPIEPTTLGNMRELGVRSLSLSCWQGHHQAVVSAERWPDDIPVPIAHGVHRLRHRRGRCAAELAGAAATGEPDRGAMANLSTARLGTKVRRPTLERYEHRTWRCDEFADGELNSAVMRLPVPRPTEPESYNELAEVCLWEADRTLDREVEQSLRTLADRFRRISERRTHASRSTER
jgi:hypothetical protein